MNDSAKKFLKGAGKVGRDIAEVLVNSMQRQARSYSRDSRFNESSREQFLDMVDSLENVKTFIHNRKSKNNVDDFEYNDYENYEDYEDYKDKDYEDFGDGIEDDETSVGIKVYQNEEMKKRQVEKSMSNTFLGNYTYEEWDKKWINMGLVKDIDIDKINIEQVGIIKLSYNGEVLCILRAIELYNGGLQKSVKAIKELSSKFLYHSKAKEIYNEINMQILCVGSERECINVVRNLEAEFLKAYNMKWM